MTREEAKAFLIELGIEEPSKLQVSGLLNKFGDVRTEIETSVKEQNKQSLEGYVKKSDYEKLLSQVNEYQTKEKENTLKDSLKSKGIKEKYLKIAMSEGLDPSSEDFEEKFKSFSESYPEFVETTNGENQQAVQPNVVNVGNVGTQPVPQVSKEDALRDSLSSEFPWLKQ